MRIQELAARSKPSSPLLARCAKHAAAIAEPRIWQNDKQFTLTDLRESDDVHSLRG
jgi:hypothetical protein